MMNKIKYTISKAKKLLIGKKKINYMKKYSIKR